jgi:iturin family lipopeptide synthetase A
MTNTELNGLEVAIIGYAGRFTGTATLDEFWQSLLDGIECIRHFESQELREQGVDESLLQNKNYVRSNGFLPDRECFDANFFGYTPLEASLMDPQIRLLHECVWEGLEHAGYSPNKYDGSIGLYAGSSSNALWQSLMALRKDNDAFVSPAYLADKDFLSSRIAYNLNLQGPAISLQTACSTSLVAVHNACRALLTNDCNIAIAGGVSVSLLDQGGYIYRENMILSPDGHCRAFDAKANGAVKGEGVGVVILKRYDKALKDNDFIHAVIKGSAINNDGFSKVGFTAPSAKGQAQVIQKALNAARIKPHQISYVETHGTGTKLGDPIEVQALTEVFRNTGKQSIALGSVKTNIGHLDAAAGVASLIKVILMLKHKVIPRTLHFDTPNPDLKLEESPFYVSRTIEPWQIGERARIAGISSFGIGGTNAHVIIQEAENNNPVQEDSARPELIQISAKSRKKLETICANLVQHLLDTQNEISLSSLSYTLSVGRKDFPFRKSFLAATITDVVKGLTDHEVNEIKRCDDKDFCRDLVFVIPGQGSQYVNMGRDLYESNELFRTHARQCFDILKRPHGLELDKIMYPGPEHDADAKTIHETFYAQLAIFVSSYSLAKTLIAFDVKPSMLLGHGIGEYVCACLAGVIDIESALNIVHERARLMQDAPRRVVFSVGCSAEVVSSKLSTDVDLAAINGPEHCVISGSDDAVKKVVQDLEKNSIQCSQLYTSHAYHSSLIDEVKEQFISHLRQFEYKKPQVPVISNITGNIVEEYSADYFAKHLASIVDFDAGVNALIRLNKHSFLEVGAGEGLTALLKSNSKVIVAVSAMRHPRNTVNDNAFLSANLGTLWTHGAKINWERVYSGQQRARIPLPGYPFERDRFPLQQELVETLKRLAKGVLPAADKSPNTEAVDWFYIPKWTPSITMGHVTGKSAGLEGTVVVFGNKGPMIGNLLARLGDDGAHCILVEAGNAFSTMSSDHYVIDAGEPDDYSAVIDHVIDGRQAPLTLIHSFSLGKVSQATNEQLKYGYLSLAYLAKAIGKQVSAGSIRLIVLSDKTVAVNDDEVIDPLKASLIGVVKIIPVEYKNVGCTILDVDPVEGSGDSFYGLLKEQILSVGNDVVVACRGKLQWVPSIRKAVPSPAARTIVIRTSGCYVITGGFGGMGFTIARDLVTRDRANVALIVRPGFPKREDWDQYVRTHPSDETSRRINAVHELDRFGSKVGVFPVDITDENALRLILSDITHEFGPINGLIWGAGVIDYGGVIQRRSDEELVSYLPSKIDGLRMFEKLIDFNAVDFVALFSSMGNVFYKSKFGQVAYCVANEFLEGFAQYGTLRYRSRIFTINWNDWRDVGMSVKAIMKAKKTANLAEVNTLLSDALSPDEGASVFRMSLLSSLRVIYISKFDLLEQVEKMINNSKTSSNGALQKPILKNYKRPDLSVPYASPENEIEKRLAGIVAMQFGLDMVGINDDFFELGGDSLKAIAIINRLEDELAIRLTLEEFFTHPTLRELASVVSTKASPLAAHKKTLTGGIKQYPLSPPQRRQYILNSLNPASIDYNQLFVFRINSIDLLLLQAAIEKIILRHSILRSSFLVIGNQLMQVVRDDIKVAVETLVVKEADLENSIRNFVRPFDLSTCPLFRVAVISVDPGKYFLAIDIHHIISDGTSNAIFLDELFKLYNGQELNSNETEYYHYVEFLNDNATKLQIGQQEKYWLNKFKGELPVLDLPTDFKRPAVRSLEGDILTLEMPPGSLEKVKRLAAQQGVSLYILSLSAFYLMLWKLTGQNDIIIGITTSGRTSDRFSTTLGMFINTLVTRAIFHDREKQSFLEFLRFVRMDVLQSIDNQLFPFEDLINKLEAPRSKNRNPIFDVLFTSENVHSALTCEEHPDEHKALQVGEQLSIGKRTASFDLRLSLAQTRDNLRYVFEYSTELFSKATIQRYGDYYRNLLLDLIADPLKEIGSIEIRDNQSATISLIRNHEADAVIPPSTQQGVHGAYTPPANETERKLVEVWSVVLNMPAKEVGVETGFFDLGGNSLKVIEMVIEVKKTMGIEIPPLEAFDHSTIRKLSDKYSHKDTQQKNDIRQNNESVAMAHELLTFVRGNK